jgi:hypothetical protein
LVVARSGGDFTDPAAAVASIGDASAANPYVVRIMPGVYTLTTPLVMKAYVDIEGSGRNVTVLEGSITVPGANLSDGPGLVNGANHAELRHLTVRNEVSAGNMVVGIYGNMLDLVEYVPSTFSIRGADVVTTYGTTASPPSYASMIGISLYYSSARIVDVNVSAQGAVNWAAGIASMYAFMDLQDSRIELVTGAATALGYTAFGPGQIAVADTASRIEDLRVVVDGTSTGKYGLLVTPEATQMGAMLFKDISVSVRGANPHGAPVSVGGAVKCLGVYDGMYNPIACQ